MTETDKKTVKRRKASKESLEVARVITEEVLPKEDVVTETTDTKEPIEQAQPAKELPKVDRSSKETQELPRVEVAKVATPARVVRVKATTTIRGVVGNFSYNIVAGEVYSLPENVASWLAERGRVI